MELSESCSYRGGRTAVCSCPLLGRPVQPPLRPAVAGRAAWAAHSGEVPPRRGGEEAWASRGACSLPAMQAAFQKQGFYSKQEGRQRWDPRGTMTMSICSRAFSERDSCQEPQKKTAGVNPGYPLRWPGPGSLRALAQADSSLCGASGMSAWQPLPSPQLPRDHSWGLWAPQLQVCLRHPVVRCPSEVTLRGGLGHSPGWPDPFSCLSVTEDSEGGHESQPAGERVSKGGNRPKERWTQACPPGAGRASPLLTTMRRVPGPSQALRAQDPWGGPLPTRFAESCHS